MHIGGGRKIFPACELSHVPSYIQRLFFDLAELSRIPFSWLDWFVLRPKYLTASVLKAALSNLDFSSTARTSIRWKEPTVTLN